MSWRRFLEQGLLVIHSYEVFILVLFIRSGNLQFLLDVLYQKVIDAPSTAPERKKKHKSQLVRSYDEKKNMTVAYYSIAGFHQIWL